MLNDCIDWYLDYIDLRTRQSSCKREWPNPPTQSKTSKSIANENWIWRETRQWNLEEDGSDEEGSDHNEHHGVKTDGGYVTEVLHSLFEMAVVVAVEHLVVRHEDETGRGHLHHHHRQDATDALQHTHTHTHTETHRRWINEMKWRLKKKKKEVPVWGSGARGRCLRRCRPATRGRRPSRPPCSHRGSSGWRRISLRSRTGVEHFHRRPLVSVAVGYRSTPVPAEPESEPCSLLELIHYSFTWSLMFTCTAQCCSDYNSYDILWRFFKLLIKSTDLSKRWWDSKKLIDLYLIVGSEMSEKWYRQNPGRSYR